MREQMIEVLRKHAQANVALHVANIECYLRNPAGIGEHSDIMEAMQRELDKIAAHEDRLDILNNYFNE
jgi:Asp/Glu/hydantoin racemase